MIRIIKTCYHYRKSYIKPITTICYFSYGIKTGIDLRLMCIKRIHFGTQFMCHSIANSMNMSLMRIVLVIILFVTYLSSFGQSEAPIEDQFDKVTIQWLDKSKFLKTFEGINEYCQNPTFRNSVDKLLATIHSYDSLVISKMEDPLDYFNWDSKEEHKTLRDVYAFEEEYGMPAFIEHMRETCTYRNEIVNNEQNLRRGVGMESYDGKVLIIETEMTKYLKKIDKLMIRIDDHLHVLHIDQ